MTKKMKTTVIGSYPVSPDTMDLMLCYFNQEDISWEGYIADAVHDMVSSGIDYVSDGQTRDPFIQLFTRKLSGCRVRDRTEIVDIVSFNKPITVDDQQFVKTVLPKGTSLIGVLTGPYTLMKSCVDFYYHNEKELAFAFATALKQEAQLLQQHVNMISIDEPFFSNSMPEYAKELLRTITEDISCPTRLHVCGDISKIVPELLDMPVDILAHEFKASPYLFDVFKDYACSKDICVGSVRSDDARVETVDEIIAHIDHAQSIFGDKITQLSPDCGQRLLPKQYAFQKLKNLVQAGRQCNG